MAIWNKNTQDYLNQERTLFEVYMQSDRYGEIFDPVGQGFNGDLFGRVKTSEPYTLFDSTHRYSQDGDFDDVVLGVGSTVGIITAQSTATLGIGTTAGCSIIRESKRVFAYQPGKALQVFQTFVFNPAKQNLIQRAGYASTENGVMLELNGSQLNIIKRTGISGVGTTISIPQSEWNRDTLDGSGPNESNPSGIALDITKAQLMFSEYEWLGVGCVRVGFVNANGKFHVAHIFNHANTLDSVYMTTASLPVRYEILNSGITTSTSTMKQICVSVQSNGGYEKRQAEGIARRLTQVSIGTTIFTPIISIRLTPGREDAIIVPTQISFMPESGASATIEVALIRNATLTTPSWAVDGSPNVQFDTASTSMSGGEIVRNDYVSSANKANVPLSVDQQYNFDLQLGRTQAKVSDTYTLAARAVSGSALCIGSLGFYDLT
jgi:hypothetical protein